MPRAKTSVVALDKHRLRLVQLVAPGTPGAFGPDRIFGCYWRATPKEGSQQGLNGSGGFVEVQSNPTLLDASTFTVTLPPAGSDGRDHWDRFYYYTDTPDVQHPGQSVGYMPGDEWLECYRGTNDLVASGTPVSETAVPGTITILCRDVVEILKKARETGAGFWNHSPRDVFEHYTRCWQALIASQFPGQAVNFPTYSSVGLVSADGKWDYDYVQAAASGPLTFVVPSGHAGNISCNETWLDAGIVDHSCWRVEVNIASLVDSGGVPSITLSVDNTTTGQPYAGMTISPSQGSIQAYTGRWGSGIAADQWLISSAGLIASNDTMAPPYTLAIEARERYVYFYVNGQCVSIAQRSYPYSDTSSTAPGQLRAAFVCQLTGSCALSYFVIRKTTPPLNGGVPGDYRLASAPSPGGLAGQYYDMTAQFLQGSLVPPGAANQVPVASRTDSGVWWVNPASGVPGWFPSALGAAGAAFARWTGSIYLPLATQDVTFRIPAGTSFDDSALWVGRTRKGEAVCTWQPGFDGGPAWGEAAGAVSVSMRSLLGEVSGWYPLVFEYLWLAGAVSDQVGFQYNLGGTGWTVPTPSAISPEGVFNVQVAEGDSHYDTVQTTVGQAFSIQWRGEPAQLESGSFPGTIVPRVRVGRDTDYVLSEAGSNNPQETSKAEDNATTNIGQAQGLGGISSGQLDVEAFNYPAMGSHPFVLSESESLPQVTDPNLLALHLATLLALRSETWQELQSDSIGQRQMQDTWPLSGVLAEFDWQPGDGLRVWLPQIGVKDTQPRPIMSLQRMLYPDGMGVNTCSFKGRPRNFAYTMRKFIRSVYASQRVFQGQLTYAPGTAAASGAATLVPLPADLTLVRQAQLVVLSKSDASAWAVNVNGSATGQAVSAVGVVDVSNFIARSGGVGPLMSASLTGGTGTCAYVLRLLELIPQG